MATRHPSGVTRLRTTTRLFIQQKAEPEVHIHFRDPSDETESESVGIFRLTVFLPFAIARLADTDSAFALGVTALAPHIDRIVDGEGASAEGFVSEIVTGVDATWNLAFFFRFLTGRLVGFTSVCLVLACLCFEAHGPKDLCPIQEGYHGSGASLL